MSSLWHRVQPAGPNACRDQTPNDSAGLQSRAGPTHPDLQGRWRPAGACPEWPQGQTGQPPTTMVCRRRPVMVSDQSELRPCTYTHINAHAHTSMPTLHTNVHELTHAQACTHFWRTSRWSHCAGARQRKRRTWKMTGIRLMLTLPSGMLGPECVVEAVAV